MLFNENRILKSYSSRLRQYAALVPNPNAVLMLKDICKKREPTKTKYYAIETFCRALLKSSCCFFNSCSRRNCAYRDLGLWMPHSVFALPFQRPERSSSPAATGCVECQSPTLLYPWLRRSLYGTSLASTYALTCASSSWPVG
jgi:hypothetical protein